MISFLIFLVILLTFRSWFGFGPISSGDMGFFYPEQIRQYLNFPFIWEAFREAGLGGASFLFQGVYFYNLPMGLLGQFLDYGLIERLIWFWPILIVGLMSPFLLARELKLFPSKFYPFSSLIFFINTYFLMVMGGGQLTVALAYILIPLAFALFLKVCREMSLKNIIFFSLALTFLVAWDFRFVYLMGIILSLYLLYFFGESFKNIRKYFKIFSVAGCFILGFHAFWILPFLFNYQNPVASFTSAYKTSEAVQFLSFADFSHAFSLLHPNWPENIFGKTYFMQWEFLMIPILAYLSLLFIGNKATRQQGNKDRMILFFALLGLIGSFLAKGSNPPFGEIYLWMFAHIPGFVMFRDPTKFYTLVALSYSILIPYSVWQIYDWLNSKVRTQKSKLQVKSQKLLDFLPNLFLLLTTFYFLLLIRPAWMGQLGGTFKPNKVPGEYLELKNFIVSQPEFFRTFWIPTQQRFTFYSDNHPAIDGTEFLKVSNISDIINQLREKDTQKKLSLAGVKYVVLPFDSEGEIFLKDRIYDEDQQQKLEQELDNTSWLKKIKFSNSDDQSKTIVYQTPGFKNRCWLEGENLTDDIKLEWRMINPTKYEIKINNLKTPSTLIFSENYDYRWIAKIGKEEIGAKKIYERLNSFRLTKIGDHDLIIEYKPQHIMEVGLVISAITIFLILIVLFLPKLVRKGYN